MKRRHFIAAGLSLAAATGARAENGPVRLRELYNKDLSFSDLAHSLADRRITVSGFMAPPLKAESTFFVLTNRPMTVCPFCETEAEWPDDILAIYTKRTLDVMPFNVRLVTRGTLELGAFKDAETGFVSRVRLREAVYERG
ncbi:hypothetical protein [Nitratireductor soli]|uniref:hypothetical protein n=1 Tax=Nitratireductor soli TaxID=1670619 RepID=UPI00065E865A|nr:hypothetical protein [Nitratireductor soli]